MKRNTAAAVPPAIVPRERVQGRGPAYPLGALLLAGSGLAVMAAGTLLGWQRGALVGFGESVLTAIAWCF